MKGKLETEKRLSHVVGCVLSRGRGTQGRAVISTACKEVPAHLFLMARQQGVGKDHGTGSPVTPPGASAMLGVPSLAGREGSHWSLGPTVPLKVPVSSPILISSSDHSLGKITKSGKSD